MPINYERLNETLATDRRAAFLVALSGNQGFLNEYFSHHCWEIMGNPTLRYDKHGNIWFRQSYDIPSGTSLAEHQQIFPPPSSRADITAPDTKFIDKKQGTVKIFEADGGRVEAAMRGFYHIITNIEGREIPQAESMGEIAAGLLMLYHGRSPLEVSEEEYQEAQRLTYQSLAMVGLDPQRLISEEKKKLMVWMPKGLSRTDSTGRFNDLISRLATEAMAKYGYIRARGLKIGMLTKNIKALQDLEAQRALERFVCTEVVEKLAKPDDLYSPHLGTMIYQLKRFIHLNGLKPVASAAAERLEKARELIDEGNRSEAYLLRLLPESSGLLTTELVIGEQLMSKLEQMQVQG